MTQHLKLAEQIGQIAKEAGKVILEVYYSPDFGVEQKADQSPLTIADQKANKVICEGLEQLETVYPIISEENKAIAYETRKDYEYVWLVDPLDGTKEFIKRNGEFTVNIALIHQQKVVLGVVYTPVSDELFWAAKGEGAYMEKEGKRTQLKAPSFSLKDKNLGVVCSRSHLNEATQAFVDQLDTPERVPKGSSLKFLILAQGKAHVYPRLAPTMEWDTGAAQIVLEEAGGQVIAEDTKAPLQYNKADLLNPHFVAYGAMKD